MGSRRKAIQKHDFDPFCYICNLHFCAEYMPIHLKVDHSKDELAAHLSLTYFDDWLDQQDGMQKALSKATSKRH